MCVYLLPSVVRCSWSSGCGDGADRFVVGTLGTVGRGGRTGSRLCISSPCRSIHLSRPLALSITFPVGASTGQVPECCISLRPGHETPTNTDTQKKASLCPLVAGHWRVTTVGCLDCVTHSQALRLQARCVARRALNGVTHDVSETNRSFVCTAGR